MQSRPALTTRCNALPRSDACTPNPDLQELLLCPLLGVTSSRPSSTPVPLGKLPSWSKSQIKCHLLWEAFLDLPLKSTPSGQSPQSVVHGGINQTW